MMTLPCRQSQRSRGQQAPPTRNMVRLGGGSKHVASFSPLRFGRNVTADLSRLKRNQLASISCPHVEPACRFHRAVPSHESVRTALGRAVAERVVAGARKFEVARVRITEAGWRGVAGAAHEVALRIA